MNRTSHSVAREVLFSMKALAGRLNAVWFHGKQNKDQQLCICGFAELFILTGSLTTPPPAAWLAYILATTYHETAATMLPVEEYGHGKGMSYGQPDPDTGQIYYGRGYVQLTWKDNYEKAQGVVTSPYRVGIVPLVDQPDQALIPAIAAQIAFSGMSLGWFTGKKLSDYLTSTQTDYVNARRIINGTDKAELIASYAMQAENAIYLASGEGLSRITVSDGSAGDDVYELQLMLGVAVDGKAGSETCSAIRAFQQKNTLKVDGICGEQTWQNLNKLIYGL